MLRARTAFFITGGFQAACGGFGGKEIRTPGLLIANETSFRDCAKPVGLNLLKKLTKSPKILHYYERWLSNTPSKSIFACAQASLFTTAASAAKPNASARLPGSGESLRKVADKRSAKTAAVESRNSKRTAKSGRGSGSTGGVDLAAANPKGYRVTPETVVTLPDRSEVRVDTSKAIDIAEKFEGQLVAELRGREISQKLRKKSKGEDLDI